MVTGTKIRCDYCGRVYKEPETGLIACPACGGPYGMEIGEPMHEVVRYPNPLGWPGRISVGSTDGLVFCDTSAGFWHSSVSSD